MKRKSRESVTKGGVAKAKAKKASSKLADVAFYYPGPVWHSGEWIKNLLLFFDGIALLVPDYLRDKPRRVDPVVAEPLIDAGLLHVLEPEKMLDKDATRRLADVLVPILESGALDQLSKDGKFHELSYSRLGGFGDQALADDLLQRLMAKGLARATEDGLSIPMQPTVRVLVLVLLSQILRPYGPTLGLDLWPATDQPQLVEGLVEVLSLPSLPSQGQVVSFDLETVGVDLSRVPMDEVLGFRKDYGKEYAAYARTLRQFVRELGQLPRPERKGALNDRQDEIRAMAHELQERGKRAWKSPASFALGIAGALWTLKLGDPIGAAIMLGLTGFGASPSAPEVGAYSYLFRARELHA